MHFSRRTFLGSLSSAAAFARVKPFAPSMTSDDPLGVRSDFPIVRKEIYLNSPYITPSPSLVTDAGRAFLEAKANGPVSLGEMLAETDSVRRKFSRLIGTSETEVGMLFATSEGENIVARALDLGAGDNVVIDDLHYETTFVLYRHLAATRGVELRIAKSRQGETALESFSKLIDNRTRLVSVAWVSHQNGFHHELRALADLAHARGAYLYTDAIQGLGMLSLDVREAGVDFLTSGSYKWLLGGYGVAPFYVRSELLDSITLDRLGSLHISRDLGDHRYELYEDARKYGYATLAFGAVFQLSAALDYLVRVGVNNIERHTVGLAHRVRQGLVDQGYEVWTPSRNRSSIVTFAHGHPVKRIKDALESARISVSFKKNDTQIRVGPALFNNRTEVDQFLEVMAGLA